MPQQALPNPNDFRYPSVLQQRTRTVGNPQQAESLSVRNRLCSFADVEFGKGILHVRFDRLGPDRERSRDLLV
jgi:hypothetical protein